MSRSLASGAASAQTCQPNARQSRLRQVRQRLVLEREGERDHREPRQAGEAWAQDRRRFRSDMPDEELDRRRQPDAGGAAKRSA